MAGLLAFSRPAVAQAQLNAVTYLGLPAFQLSDGRTEAMISAEMGNVLSYGLHGGVNFLWNAPAGDRDIIAWSGWGGGKTWLGPQSSWLALLGRAFPPDPAWAARQRAEILPGARLRLTGAVSAGGVELGREFGFNDAGELVIQQTAQKLAGPPVLLCLWSDVQVAPCDGVYLPLSEHSIYAGKFCWMSPPRGKPRVRAVTSNMLRVQPEFSATTSEFYKIGTDSPVAAIACRRGEVLFVQRAAKPAGDYADSAPGGGLAVQYFHHGKADSRLHYDELELLSPVRLFRVGTSWTHTVRWRLVKLTEPGTDQIEPLLQPAP